MRDNNDDWEKPQENSNILSLQEAKEKIEKLADFITFARASIKLASEQKTRIKEIASILREYPQLKVSIV